MLVRTHANINDIKEQGKLYQWERLEQCPRCHSTRVWGHGYVARYFHMFLSALFLKRWRCDSCNAVHVSKPKGYEQPWCRCPVSEMLRELSFRLQFKRWDQVTRQRGGHWLKNITGYIQMFFPLNEKPVSELLADWHAAGLPLWRFGQNKLT